jgi:hypothetical protein
VSKKFGEWYQKTNKTADKNKLTLLAFKTIIILHNTLYSTVCGVQWVDFFLFPHLKNIMKGARFADVAAIQEHVTAVL